MFTTVKDFALESITALLAFFYQLPVIGDSFGFAIMMLTATVMIVLMPLTIKATRSTIKMTQLQPELRALQKEYKDNKQELNQAMMGLYQEHGVNPVGGCLPMLAQLPVFLVLFNVLRGLTRRVSEKPYFAVSEQAGALTGATGRASDTFDPKYLDHDTELFQDLSTRTTMDFGPFDLAADAWNVLQSDFLGSLPYIVLILFVVGSSFFQQRQVTARRGTQPDNPTPQQQTQQQLLRVLPLMSGIWSFLFPAGLVLYWATSNLFRIGQQAYITRALYSEDDAVSTQAGGADGKSQDEDSSSQAAGKKTSTKKGSAETDDPIGDGRPGRKSSSGSKNGVSRNGSSSSESKSASRNGSRSKAKPGEPADRNEAWAERRAQRTKAQAAKKKTSTDGSSRTTPKGTKPPGSKKKRKR